MQTQVKKFYDYRCVLDMYEDPDKNETLSSELTQVIKYFKEGSSFYNRNIRPVSESEIYEMIQFAEQLRDLANEMDIDDDTGLIVKNDYLSLKIDPLIEFLRNHDINQVLQKLSVMTTWLITVLNEHNILDFKSAFETIDRLQIMFDQMNRD